MTQPHPLITLVTACLSLARRSVLGFASSGSKSTRTTSTRSPTPQTASGTSARSATGPSAASRVLHYSEAQALQVAGNVLSLWSQAGELPEEQGGELQRLFAEALQVATAEASHLGSVATTNDFIQAHNMTQDRSEAEQLAFFASVESKRVDALLHLLRDLSRAMLIQVGVLNELASHTDDEQVQGRLQLMQRSVIQNENVVRTTIERTEEAR